MPKTLDRQAKVILKVYCAFNELIDKGFLEGKKFPVTPEGEEYIKDFEPTPEEFYQTLEAVIKYEHIEII